MTHGPGAAEPASPAIRQRRIRRIEPRWRGREARLLAVAGLVLGIGWVGLASTQAQRLTVGDPGALIVLLAMLAVVHLALVVDGRRRDQVMLPVVGLLMGLSVLLMSRLPQDLVVQRIGPIELPLVSLQLLWIGLSLGIAAAIAVGLRNDLLLRSYKYTWAVAGIVLLLLVFVLGDETNGARLTLHVGPFAGQPSELLKIILVVFLAAYLADNRALLSGRDSRLGQIRLPPLVYLLPMLVIWGLALATVVVQRDLGAALLFYGVFLLLLYVATQRRDLLAIGIVLFLAGGVVLYALFPHVQERVQIWFDPFATAQGAGFQVVRGLYALGRGGVVGTGLGAGLPGVGGAPSIPAVHTDFVFAALGEELGLAGGLAILALYAVFAERGLRIAAGARDEFRALLAAGLTLVIVVQAAIIVAGNAKLIPLTGITLPWIAYGGSSMLAGGVVLGLLLSVAVEEQPGAAPERVGWRERVGDASRAAAGRVERVLR